MRSHLLLRSARRAAAVVAGLAACAGSLGAQATGETDPVAGRMEERLAEVAAELIEIRRDFQRHRELSGQEERTAGIVAQRLRKLGLDVQTGVGGHGVVGLIVGGQPGPVVAYRADMDAVPSPAPDPVDFRSETPGVRHICGHDIHTTVGLALAEAFAAVRDELPGTVKLIFQPAEENIQGARAMIADGVLESPEPDAIWAVHTAPLEVGHIGVIEGMALPGLDVARITLTGDGDLAAAAQAYAAVFEDVSTVGPPGPDMSLSGVTEFVFAYAAGSEPAGDDSWVVQGFVKASGEDQYSRAKADILAKLERLEFDAVSHEIQYVDRWLADTINDQDLLEASLPAIVRSVGPDGVITSRAPIPYFGEDFSFFQREIPGVIFWLGVSNSDKGIVGMPHSPGYVADEGAIQVGARTMGAVILEYLRTGT